MQFRSQKPFPKDDAGNDIESSMTKPIAYYATKEMVSAHLITVASLLCAYDILSAHFHTHAPLSVRKYANGG